MMRRPALACAALGVPALALLTEAATGPGEQRPAEPLVETIVHTTLRPPNWDLYLFEKPGGPPRRLTDDPALDYNAVFSPDGRWIVFTSEREGGADLWALDLQGSGASARLTRHHAMDDAAAFSPDGRRLAFVSTREGNADIFVMPFAPSDVTAEERAANLTRRPGGDINPAFSPDGRSIAFSRQDELWEPRERFAQVRHNYGVQLYVWTPTAPMCAGCRRRGRAPRCPASVWGGLQAHPRGRSTAGRCSTTRSERTCAQRSVAWARTAPETRPWCPMASRPRSAPIRRAVGGAGSGRAGGCA